MQAQVALFVLAAVCYGTVLRVQRNRIPHDRWRKAAIQYSLMLALFAFVIVGIPLIEGR